MANKIKYGIRNVKYAVITENEKVHSYGTVDSLPGAVSLSISAAGDQVDFYADDILYFAQAVNQGYTGDLVIADIPEAFMTSVLGFVKDENDALIESADAKPKQFALGFEFQGDQKGTKVWLYNCSVARPSQDLQTKESGITPATDTLSIIAAPRPEDMLVRVKITETDGNLAIYEDFLDTVYDATIPSA